jgi:hypothetical protein
MDLFGPTTNTSEGGNLCCLVTTYTCVFFLQKKSKVASTLKRFAKKAQNEFVVKINKIISDNGREFDNSNIEKYCDEVGIKHEVSTTYPPQ